MDHAASGQRFPVVDRRQGIVSGKKFGSSQTYPARPQSPDQPQPAGVGYSSAAAMPWNFGNPEMKRRKRIAKYKVYTVEGKVKSSVRKGLRWFKNKCHELIHGY